jgi:hypothetical protein
MASYRVLDEVTHLPDDADAVAFRRFLRQTQEAEKAAPDPTPRTPVEALQREVGQLQLYVSVLMHIVKSRGLVSKEDLRALIDMADLEDGVRDGMRAGDPLE